MTEEQLQSQEKRRREVENKVKALKEGSPLPGSLKELMQAIEGELNANAVLKEFIDRANTEVSTAISKFSMLPVEQNLNLDNVATELANVRDKLAELNDNFNVFASKMLSHSEQRLELMRNAVQIIDAELTR